MENLFKKIKVFSESHSRKVKHWFSYGQGNYCRSGLQKKCVIDEATSAYTQNEDRKTGSILVTTHSLQE